MFLRRVYLYNRLLFAVMFIFITGQLFINYKRGAVITPFYNYGMYSHKIFIEKNYTVTEIFVNGKLLNGSSFAPHVWDKLLLPVEYYIELKKSNQLYQSEITRLLNKVKIKTDQKNFIQYITTPQFMNWYKTYVASILHIPVNRCTIQQRIYTFTNHTLQPTNTVTTLSQLCN